MILIPITEEESFLMLSEYGFKIPHITVDLVNNLHYNLEIFELGDIIDLIRYDEVNYRRYVTRTCFNEMSSYIKNLDQVKLRTVLVCTIRIKLPEDYMLNLTKLYGDYQTYKRPPKDLFNDIQLLNNEYVLRNEIDIDTSNKILKRLTDIDNRSKIVELFHNLTVV